MTRDLLISYMALRKAIGYLAVAFPAILVLGTFLLAGQAVMPTISDYHFSPMRDVFSGVLFAIGTFLFSYRGPQRHDTVAGSIACMALVGVVLFPPIPGARLACSGNCVAGFLHLACAAVFFAVLIYFAVVLFRKTDPAKIPTRQKLARNALYLACGLLIGAAMTLIGVYFMLVLLHSGWLPVWEPYNPVFWLETLAVESFGLCWLVKGGWMLQDMQAQSVPVHLAARREGIAP